MKTGVQDQARGFSQLSDPTRLGILQLLVRGPKNVTALCESLKLKQPTTSHHLALLRMGGFVKARRNGKQVIYSLNTDMLKCLSGELANYLPELVRK